MRAPYVLLAALLLTAPALHAAEDAAALVDQAAAAMRRNPEQTRSLAQAALAQLAARPDADLQARAHLLLCDYHSERDRAAAERHAAQARALLPAVKRGALRAGLLGCEVEIHENAGENAQALARYEEAVGVAEAACAACAASSRSAWPTCAARSRSSSGWR
jgi:hypothetical protein